MNSLQAQTGANIQAYPTPEIWIGKSLPFLFEREDTETVSIVLESAFLQAVEGISETGNTESIVASLTVASYVAAPIVTLAFTDNTESQMVSLSLADLIAAASSSQIENDETLAVLLTEAEYFLSLVSMSESDNAETLTVSLSSANYTT